MEFSHCVWVAVYRGQLLSSCNFTFIFQMELGLNHNSYILQIFVNGKEKQKVKSAHLTKALVEKLDLSRPQHFSIQTVADNSQVSKMADTLFEDVLPEPLGESGSDRESDRDGDVSSAISSNQYEDGERRVVS